MKLKMLTYVSSVVIVALCATPINAAYFSIPYDAEVYISFFGGEAAANTEFGIGTSGGNRTTLLTNLPNNPTPTAEVFAGSFATGTLLDFYQITDWHYGTYWAFSDNTDQASNIAFLDVNNSLNLGGSTIQRISDSQWLFHLDDAASYNVDDDNNDIVLQMRLAAVSSNPPVSENVPEPSVLILMASGLIGLGFIRNRILLAR